MDNIEIEMRIQLENPDELLKWLRANAQLTGTQEQTDHYFNQPFHSFLYVDKNGYQDADNWLRVRLGSKNQINYKKWYRDSNGKSLYADEFETAIEDGQQVIEILQRLGFEIVSTIKKHREKWHYNDFTFDCDDVEGLGFFVEIEYSGYLEDRGSLHIPASRTTLMVLNGHSSMSVISN